MELRQLRYFMAAARSESFRAAADELHVAQSALSRRIADLEAELGTLLFNRRNGRVHLSATGHYYLQQIAPIVSNLDDVNNHIAKFGGESEGELTIGYNPVAGRHKVVSNCLKTFRDRHPKTEVRPVEMTSTDQERAILAGEIDCGFCYRYASPPAGLQSGNLWTDRMHAAFPKGHELSRSKEIYLKDLVGEEFVFSSPKENSAYFYWMMNCCRRGGLNPRVVQFANSLPIVFSLITAGLGIGLVLAADAMLWQEDLVLRLVKDFPDSKDLTLMWNSRRPSSELENFLSASRDSVQRLRHGHKVQG